MFGPDALIHRCHVREKLNIKADLPERYHAAAMMRLIIACGMNDYDEALSALKTTVILFSESPANNSLRRAWNGR